MNRFSRRYIVLALSAFFVFALGACIGGNSTPEPSPAEVEAQVQEQLASLELVGTSWRLDYFGEESDGISAIEGTNATVNFFVDRYAGTGGCNYFLGVYNTDGSAIQILTPSQSRVVCAEPEGIMEQDATFVSTLLNSVEYGLEGEQLVLFTTGQQRLATLSPTESVALEGTTWSLRFAPVDCLSVASEARDGPDDSAPIGQPVTFWWSSCRPFAGHS